jgi:hypothetical protein
MEAKCLHCQFFLQDPPAGSPTGKCRAYGYSYRVHTLRKACYNFQDVRCLQPHSNPDPDYE